MATRGEGPPKITGIEIGEMQTDFINHPLPVLTAKFALVNMDESARMGYSNASVWSPETMARLDELKKSMETDICRNYFFGGSSPQPAETTEDQDDAIVPKSL